MKKLASIFLLVVFGLNIIGPRLMFCFKQQQSDIQLQASLDKDLYDQSDLLTIKVPLSLPYLSSNTDFERIDGEITFNGKIYKYVKRKIFNGELVLLCLADYNKMRLQSEANDLYKNVNDEITNSSSKKPGNSKVGSLKNIFSEYNKSEINYTSAIYKETKSFSSSNSLCTLISFPRTTPEQPPETD